MFMVLQSLMFKMEMPELAMRKPPTTDRSVIMSGDMNSADLRRIVQSYKDMCDIVVETVGDEKQHNALVSAIREAAERRRVHD